MESNVVKTLPDYATKDAESGVETRAVFGNYHVMHVASRVVCLSACMASVVVMVSAKEKSTLSLYGFDLPIYSKWSFSDSFDYLVGVSAAAAAHSLLQLIMTSRKLIKKSSIISSKKHAWLLFAADQVFAYAMMSCGSASSGVTNLNRTGIKHSSLPNFCKPLQTFCDRVALSIAFAFFGCFLLAMLSVLDVVWLSEY
ncbi:CASP-like protein 3A1 [Bidens hawaiensis]|uniref:CASP-like protein 3A1 n=1 Tax=Bidens hawaiensis TaxID=980011 RepID=UPI0040490A41